MKSKVSPARIRQRWTRLLRQLEAKGPPAGLNPRELCGLYAAASICYHGNDESVISDVTFDALCRWILDHFEECRASGADMLDQKMLACCSGYDLSTFVKPYHDIVAILLGHACQCYVCQRKGRSAAA